jgi:peptide-methionine (S)-S-oxide reductase
MMNMFRTFVCLSLVFACQVSSAQTGDPSLNSSAAKYDSETKVATFGGGCFWCVEAVFERVKGVKDVISGYAGGRNANPTYRQVCTGRTGHAEVCQIIYDPGEVTFTELLEVFWKTHDPTTLNRQGADVGTQYRSVIFYHDDEQRELAETYKKKLDASGAFPSKIVTEISKAPEFYAAEPYHQDYYEKNPNQGYCAAVIRPKVAKFNQVFAGKLAADKE